MNRRNSSFLRAIFFISRIEDPHSFKITITIQIRISSKNGINQDIISLVNKLSFQLFQTINIGQFLLQQLSCHYQTKILHNVYSVNRKIFMELNEFCSFFNLSIELTRSTSLAIIYLCFLNEVQNQPQVDRT